MPQQQYLAFADGGGANVQDQASYAANPYLTVGWPDGYSPLAAEVNKAIRQATSMTSAIAQSMADITGSDVLDDGNAANLIATFKSMLQQATSIGYLLDTGAVNAYVITPVPAVVAYKGGQTFFMVPANTNTAASTVTASGLGVKAIVHSDGSAVLPGDIPAGGGVQLIYSAALGKFILNSVVTQFGSAWFRVPNSKYIVQWVAYNIAIGSTSNVSAPATAGSGTVSYPITFPNTGDFCHAAPKVSTNTGQATAAYADETNTTGQTLFVTDTSTTGFARGSVLAIGH